MKNAADPGPHIALAAFEPCGCTGWISVLGYGHDADAYKTAAKEAKAGLTIKQVLVEEWKARPSMFCADHPKGPPWWKVARRERQASRGMDGPTESRPVTRMSREAAELLQELPPGSDPAPPSPEAPENRY